MIYMPVLEANETRSEICVKCHTLINFEGFWLGYWTCAELKTSNATKTK